MTFGPKVWFLFCLAIIAIPIFGCLDTLPIQLWDESRLANNSLEMYKARHWMVSTFNGEPDTWNTKPPFLLWLQIISFKLFGVNELALRLPSAIAGALTCIVIYWFFARQKRYMVGVLATLVLVTSMGFIKYHHSPRTGDYDAMLTLFTTCYCLFYFIYIDENKRRFLWLTIFAITLAAMTKCSAGLIYTPALFIYTVYRKKLVTVLKQPATYIGILIFMLVLGGYYLLREKYTPGYIKIAIENDWWGRFNKYNGTYGYSFNPLHYYTLLVETHFKYWYLLLFAGIVLGLYSADINLKRITGYVSLMALFYFAVITKAVNKSDWYDMPIYPMISIITAIGIFSIWKILSGVTVSPALVKNVLPAAFLLIICLPPYVASFFDSLNPDPGKWIENNTNMCRYLKSIYHEEFKAPAEIVVVKKDYAANIDWYEKVLNDKKIPCRVINFDSIEPFQRVMAFEWDITANIENHYNFSIIERLYNNTVTIYQLNGKK